MTNQNIKTVIQGLGEAMRAEHEGYHFYMMAAKSTTDPKGRKVFEQLAKEEMDHFNYLSNHLESLEKSGKPSENVVPGKPLELTGEHPIFSDALMSRIQEAHFEMTALSIAVQLELNAEKFYTQQAQSTDIPVIKEFYRIMAEWESGHYQALLAQQESLKESYWDKAGFAPF